MSEAGRDGLPSPADLTLQIAESGKEINRKPYCLFISGGFGTNAGIHGINEGLRKQYGAKNVKGFNSVFNFEDPQNPNRFNEMADFIQAHAKDGLDIIAHSLGASELKKAIDQINKRDGTFFDNEENTNYLHVVLIGPSGFSKNPIESVRYGLRTLRFVTSPLLRGIDALTAFPPEGISPVELTLALREAMPELSHYSQDVESIPLSQDEGFVSHLSEPQKKEIAIYSQMMLKAINEGNYSGLRHLVAVYGKLLKKPLKEVFAGSFESEEKEILEATRATMGGHIGLIDTLVKGFGSKTMKELAVLKDKGVRIDFLVPEHDVLYPLDKALAFFEESPDASSHSHLAEGVAHAFPALQAMRFGEMIKNLNQGNTSQ